MATHEAKLRDQSQVPHVGIIGAGMSGLRCAEVLLNKGVNVTILEARDRYGGRLHQSSRLGHLVDLGPNWIHGTENNPIIQLATITNSVTTTHGELNTIFDKSGHLLTKKEAETLNELFWGLIDDAFKYSRAEGDSIPEDKSLLDFILEQIKPKELEPELKEHFIQLAAIWGAYIGTPIERQSLKFFWLEEVIDGGNALCQGRQLYVS
jgi:hypothetical protein